MYKVLLKEKEERTDKDFKEMLEIVKEIPFFKERKMADSDLIDVFNCMTVLPVEKGHTIMEYGDIGDNFYFILTG